VGDGFGRVVCIYDVSATPGCAASVYGVTMVPDCAVSACDVTVAPGRSTLTASASRAPPSVCSSEDAVATVGGTSPVGVVAARRRSYLPPAWCRLTPSAPAREQGSSSVLSIGEPHLHQHYKRRHDQLTVEFVKGAKKILNSPRRHWTVTFWGRPTQPQLCLIDAWPLQALPLLGEPGRCRVAYLCRLQGRILSLVKREGSRLGQTATCRLVLVRQITPLDGRPRTICSLFFLCFLLFVLFFLRALAPPSLLQLHLCLPLFPLLLLLGGPHPHTYSASLIRRPVKFGKGRQRRSSGKTTTCATLC
jgi:hypothetical protein